MRLHLLFDFELESRSLVLRALKQSVFAELLYDVETLNFDEIPFDAFNAKRNQYNAKALIEYFELKLKKSQQFGFYHPIWLYITENDLYLPSEHTSFVFGAVRLNHGGVISLGRLDQDIQLVTAELTHEIGHCFGLSHCNNNCTMKFARNTFEIRLRRTSFVKFATMLFYKS